MTEIFSFAIVSGTDRNTIDPFEGIETYSAEGAALAAFAALDRNTIDPFEGIETIPALANRRSL